MVLKVDYIKRFFKIESDNPLVIKDIAEEIDKNGDFEDFRNWLKEYSNHIDFQYLNGFQRFIKLSELYSRKTAEANNQDRLGKSSSYAIKLAQKVKDVSNHVLDNNDLKYMHFVTPDGCFFSDFDIKQLDRVSSLLGCVRLQVSVSGEDELLNRLDENMKQIVMSNALGYTKKEALPNKTMSAVQALTQKVKA